MTERTRGNPTQGNPTQGDPTQGESSRGGSRRRQEIFQIAAEIFYRKGYDQTSTKDIAGAAGILKGSLYAHIDSKEDILYAIIEDIHRLFERNVADCAAFDAPPLERLRGFLAGHMRVAMTEVRHHQIYQHDWRSLSREHYLAIRRKRDAYQRYLADLLEAAQKAGHVRTDIDCRLLAMSVLSMLNSVHTWYRPEGEFSADAVAASYCDLVLRGVVGEG